MNKLLIWGKGGHSDVVVETAIRLGMAITLIDDNSNEFLDNSWINKYPPNKYLAFVAIGNNYYRSNKFNILEELGYQFPNIISPRAYIASGISLAIGIFIAPMAVIMTKTDIGKGTIINTGATVDHGCVISPFVHLAPGCHLCGNVTVANHTLVGVGTSIIPNVIISHDIVIAGGSSVCSNLWKDRSLYAGNPAVFKREIHEPTR